MKRYLSLILILSALSVLLLSSCGLFSGDDSESTTAPATTTAASATTTAAPTVTTTAPVTTTSPAPSNPDNETDIGDFLPWG